MDGKYIAVPTREEAIARHRAELEASPTLQEKARRELRGKDLACYRKLDEECHADVLLAIANANA